MLFLNAVTANHVWCFVLQTQECTDEDVAEQADSGNRCSDVEMLLVRCVEKEIDNLDGKLKSTVKNHAKQQDVWVN